MFFQNKIWGFNVKFENLKKMFIFLACKCNSIVRNYKVVRVVKLKLVFMKWFFINLVILMKLYKIRYLNLDKPLLFPRKQAICLKNWKLWRAPTATKFNIFCWNFARALLTNVYKTLFGIFLFCLDLELLIKM